MEQLLLVINAHHPNIASIDFACEIARIAQTKLTGLFIENVYFEYIPTTGVTPYFKRVYKSDNPEIIADTDQSVRIFKEQCLRKGITPEIYIDQGEPIKEIVYESRFADLLIVDPNISFEGKDEPLPSRFVKDLLAEAECPVLLAPEKFDNVEEIVFCYDGSASSVFAIKQFTYLFPEFHKQKVVLLEVNRSGNEEFNESHRRTMNWLRAHFQSVYYNSLGGNARDELFTYFFMKQKKLIVLGAYGRSMLSNFFKKSSADLLIRTVDLPIFITHH